MSITSNLQFLVRRKSLNGKSTDVLTLLQSSEDIGQISVYRWPVIVYMSVTYQKTKNVSESQNTKFLFWHWVKLKRSEACLTNVRREEMHSTRVSSSRRNFASFFAAHFHIVTTQNWRTYRATTIFGGGLQCSKSNFGVTHKDRTKNWRSAQQVHV